MVGWVVKLLVFVGWMLIRFLLYRHDNRLTPHEQRQRELKQEKKDKKKAAAGLLMGRR